MSYTALQLSLQGITMDAMLSAPCTSGLSTNLRMSQLLIFQIIVSPGLHPLSMLSVSTDFAAELRIMHLVASVVTNKR